MLKEKSLHVLIRFAQSGKLKHVPLFQKTGSRNVHFQMLSIGKTIGEVM
jgi:hypothetical protein